MIRKEGRHAISRNDRGKIPSNLVTVQPVAVWERLRREKRLSVDPAHPDFYGSKYRLAYDWLRGQMRERLCGYAGHYPW